MSSPAMLDESHLTKCFEMLIERLDSIETNCDAFQTYTDVEQNNRVGCIDTLAWGLDVDLFVHKPRVPLKPFERPVAFLMKTSFFDSLWQYRMSLQDVEHGKFDDVFRGCDLAYTKKLLSEMDEKPVMCRFVGLKSSRADVLDHLGDIQLTRWLRRQESSTFNDISCNWSNSDTVSFWLTPTKDEVHPSRAKKTSIRECVETLLKLLRDLDGTSERLEIQVYPATIQEMDLLKTLDMVEYRIERGVDDDDTALEEKAIRAIQDDRCLVEAIELHFGISCSKDMLRCLSHLL